MNFSLPQSIIKATNNVRVSITTIPEELKQAYILKAEDMKSTNHYFHINITPSTRKIVFVFRKKGFFDDPIIGSTILYSKDFPKYNDIAEIGGTQEIHTISIYEPLCISQKDNHSDIVPTLMERRIIGQMQFELSLTDPIHVENITKCFSEKYQIQQSENSNPNQIETLFQSLFQ